MYENSTKITKIIFHLSKSRLDSLEKSEGVRKVEYDPSKSNSVSVYFSGMPKGKERCWTFRVKQEKKVEELKPAIATIFEYYKTENKVLSYTVHLQIPLFFTKFFPI